MKRARGRMTNGSGEARATSCERGIAAPVFVDAFAGCGGLSLGLMRAGWKGLFAIEKDPCAFETLSANLSYDWPTGIEQKPWDIHGLLSTREDVLANLAGKVDLLAGGPPCQGFSHAGRRRPDDPRNQLFKAYLELVRILQPRLLLLENVRGFTCDFKVPGEEPVENFAESLQQWLQVHHDMAYQIVHAAKFGIPQTRPRYFLVAALKGLGIKREIDAVFEDLEQQVDSFLGERQLPRWPTAKDAISDLEADRNGTVPSRDSKGFEEISYKEPLTAYQKLMRKECKQSPTDTRLARHRPDIRERFKAIINTCREEGQLKVTVPAEIREAHGMKKMVTRVLDPFDSAPTITSLPDDLLHYSEPRILTVRENARLQSFPDWFKFKGKYTTGGNRRRNEVPRFTQVANAVPPLLAEQLGLVLLRVVGRLCRCEFVTNGSTNAVQCAPVLSERRAKIRHPVLIDNDVSFFAE